MASPAAEPALAALSIRRAGEADNAALLALTASLDLPGIVRFGVDRTPDFFALDRVLGGESHAMVVEIDRQLAGFVDVCRLRVRAGQRLAAGALITLAGMAERHRGKGFFLPMLRALERDLRALDTEIAIGFTSRKNARAQAFAFSWEHQALVAEAVQLHVLLAGRGPRAMRETRVRQATAADLPAIDALVAAHRSRYDVAVVVPPLGAPSYPGLVAEDFLVAIDAGRIVACLALWDQSAWRRNPVHGYSPAMRLLKTGVDALLQAQRRPALPARGGNLRFCHVAFPAAYPGSEPLFRELLRHAMTALRTRGLHFLALGLPAHDPLSPAVHGLVRFTMEAVPFLAVGPEDLRAAVTRRAPPRVWVDYALL